MNCPKCQKEMEKVAFGSVELDRCTDGCGGIWFDAHEVDVLCKADGSESIDTGSFTKGQSWNTMYKIECPRCRALMAQHSDMTRPHIKFELCPKCHGMFLDAGEFTHYKNDTFIDYVKSVLQKDATSEEDEG